MQQQTTNTRTLVLMALFVALSYIGTMMNIQLPTPVGKTMIHFGNIFCLIAALMLGGWRGGLCGSLGMGLFDLTSAGFFMYAPSTMILKFFIGLICGSVYSKIKHKFKNRYTSVFISSSLGMLFNVIFDPIGSYFVSKYLLHSAATTAKIVATWAAGATAINALIAVVFVTIFFGTAKGAMEKNGLLK